MDIFDIGVIVKTCGDKIGFLSNSKMTNVTTSGIGVGLTAGSCARSCCKGFATPIPLCKGLYFTAAALNAISCGASTICLLAGTFCIAPIPVAAGVLAYGASVGARGCNALGDCMDPRVAGITKGVDHCIDEATKNWS